MTYERSYSKRSTRSATAKQTTRSTSKPKTTTAAASTVSQEPQIGKKRLRPVKAPSPSPTALAAKATKPVQKKAAPKPEKKMRE